MVWGGKSFNGRTQLVIVRNGLMTAARYRDDIIVPHAENFGPNFIFMHDNTKPHIAHIVTIALRNANIDSLEWPAKSPDLNSIEHLWDHINRRVKTVHVPPINLEEMSNLLLQEWHQIPQQSIQNLIKSMPRRMQECTAIRGGNTSS
jgi:transposase